MIEAGVAYYEATGKTVLLDTVCRLADHIYRHFVTEGNPGYPGHPEIELALMRLFQVTGEEKYRDLAAHFLNVRGQDPAYFEKEAENRDWYVWSQFGSRDRTYAQNHMPVRDMDRAVGHAVRAAYLYSGMADLAAETGDRELTEACRRIWDNITQKQMYITGGIGASAHNEAFSVDYNLPNDIVYAETCASIALVFFARRMLELESKGEFADVMERALYNTVLAGIQLDGKQFFYVNPLEVIPGISGVVDAYKHVLPQRPKWYGCACCPPNAARTIGSLAKYAWGIKGKTVYSHLFVGGELDLTEETGARICVETRYPYDGHVSYRLEGEPVTLAVRIPSWSRDTRLSVDGRPVPVAPKDGYQYIEGAQAVELVLDMEPRRYYANVRVASDSGMAAVQRGPIVYCAEGVDNGMDVLSLRLKKDGKICVLPYTQELCGCVKLEAEGFRAMSGDQLYSDRRPELKDVRITLVPYYTWGNRGINEMRVWLPEA